jgi:hypothetical protein
MWIVLNVSPRNYGWPFQDLPHLFPSWELLLTSCVRNRNRTCHKPSHCLWCRYCHSLLWWGHAWCNMSLWRGEAACGRWTHLLWRGEGTQQFLWCARAERTFFTLQNVAQERHNAYFKVHHLKNKYLYLSDFKHIMKHPSVSWWKITESKPYLERKLVGCFLRVLRLAV